MLLRYGEVRHLHLQRPPVDGQPPVGTGADVVGPVGTIPFICRIVIVRLTAPRIVPNAPMASKTILVRSVSARAAQVTTEPSSSNNQPCAMRSSRSSIVQSSS